MTSTSATKSSIATTNPATGEVVAEFTAMSDEQVSHAIERAHAAYTTVRELTVAERAAWLMRAAELMSEREDELANLLTLEMGKLTMQAHGEVKLSAAILKYYGRNAETLLAPKDLDVKVGAAELVSAPLGVLLGVMPWNFPYYQVVRFAAPNLAAGNTVLVKHASICPQSAAALEKLFVDAGAPQGAYTNLVVSSGAIDGIIANPIVQGVSLTGSEAAGAAVAESAGRNLKKVVLELGGSDPFIVLDDVNLERTIDAAFVGRMANTGQSCIASKRMIVLDAAYDRFLEGLKTAMGSVEAGDPSEATTALGPLSSEQAASDLVEQIESAVSAGATLELGGKRIDRAGAFVEPTILTGVTSAMDVYREELFGPVAVVYRAKDEAEAIEIANATPFGLGGTVMGADDEQTRRVAGQVESGMVWINQPTASQPDLPFGGIKTSGFGRELGTLGITEFLNHKLVRRMPADSKVYGAPKRQG